MTDPDDAITAVAEALGHRFEDPALLREALTHCSFANEHPEIAPADNDRLEFLGDAVLQWVISSLLWRRFPNADAGEMTRRRADLVCAQGLDRIAREVQIADGLRLGKGEEKSGGREKPRLLSSALEACVAAVYLDGGPEAALRVCDRLFGNELARWAPGERDYKTRLQEAMQRAGVGLPRYRVESVTGPDHEKTFKVSLVLRGELSVSGEGRSKVDAEQEAARQALGQLPDLEPELPSARTDHNPSD